MRDAQNSHARDTMKTSADTALTAWFATLEAHECERVARFVRDVWGPLEASFRERQPVATLRAYWARLGHIEDARVATAVSRCVDDLERFPSIAEIRARLPEPKRDERTAEVWSRIVGAALCGHPEDLDAETYAAVGGERTIAWVRKAHAAGRLAMAERAFVDRVTTGALTLPAGPRARLMLSDDTTREADARALAAVYAGLDGRDEPRRMQVVEADDEINVAPLSGEESRRQRDALMARFGGGR